MITLRARVRWMAAPALAVAAVLPLAAQEVGGEYSYFLAVEGSATVLQGDADTRSAAEVNLPILVGDRLVLDTGSRLGILLSDGDRLHLEGPAEVGFDRLAFSPEVDDRQTQINLASGRLHFAVANLWQVDEATRVDTANATVYLQDAGEYLVAANGWDFTEIVVRSGFAEVLTRRGSSVVRSGERLLVDGDRWPRVSMETAPGPDLFEDWVRRQEDIRLAQSSTTAEVFDEPLQYQAADLDEHGQWVEVEGSRVWRPVVEEGWRPYWHGRWAYTPSGLYWVSYDPWSPITYHYGTWDYLFGYGWVWYPGRVYAPAHVYWYWGPSYVAWVPWGYYGHYYGHHYSRFSFGLHLGTWGAVGGPWGYYDRWVFCPPRYLGHRDQYRHHDDSRGARGRLGTPEVPRGILTDDTRGLTPDTWTKTDEVEKTLLRRLRSERPGGVDQMPDATPFVAREERLPPTLERRIAEAPIQSKPAKVAPVRFMPSPPRGSGSGSPGSVDVRRGTVGSAPVGKGPKGSPLPPSERPAPRPAERATEGKPAAKPTRPTVVPPREPPSTNRGQTTKPAPRSKSPSAKDDEVVVPRTPVLPPRTAVPAPEARREPATTRMKTPTTADRSRANDSARRVLEPIRSRPVSRAPRAVAPTPSPAPKATARPTVPSRGVVTRSPRSTAPAPRPSVAPRPTTKPRASTVRPPTSRKAPSSSKQSASPARRQTPSVSRSRGAVSRPSVKPSTVKSRPSVPGRSSSVGRSGGSSRRSSSASSRPSPSPRSSGGKPASKPSKPRH